MSESNRPQLNKSPLLRYADELPDNCPPEEAADASGTFYATHRTLPPDGKDFRTAAARGLFKGRDECRRRGNSIMESVDDAKQLCLAHPDVHVHVSEGVLRPEHGKLLINSSNRYPSHHTLWRFEGVEMHNIFVEVV